MNDSVYEVEEYEITYSKLSAAVQIPDGKSGRITNYKACWVTNPVRLYSCLEYSPQI